MMSAQIITTVETVETIPSSSAMAQPTPFRAEPVLPAAMWGYKEGGDLSSVSTATFTRWAVCLHRDAEDPQGWVTADVIGLKGVASEGRTDEDALSNAHEAIQALGHDAVEQIDQEKASGYVIPAGAYWVYLSIEETND